MRRGDQYNVGEGDDILARENAIHSDIDMRLDNVEEQLEAAKDGNRVDLDLLISRYTDTVAGLALRVDDLLNLAKTSISASIITETSSRQFLTPARREAILDEIRGDVSESANTLAELHNLIQGYATPGLVAAAINDLVDNAPSDGNTLRKLSTALDAVAAKVAAITAGVAASRDTLKEVSDAADLAYDLALGATQAAGVSTGKLNALFAGAPAARDTLLELSNAIDTVAAAVAAVTAGAPASRDTLKEVSGAVDAVAASVAAITAGSASTRDTLKEVSDALDAVAASVAAITAGSTSTRDTLKEVSDALDALSATVAGLTAGAAASRDTFAEVGTALDTQNAAINNRLRFDAAQTLTSAQADQAVTNALLNDRFARIDGQNVGPLGNRNKFINGAFEVWQRGASMPAQNYNNKYVCDMTSVIQSTAATYSYQKFIDPDDQKTKMLILSGTVVPEQTQYILKVIIEDVRTFAGKRVAVSFTAKKYGAVPDYTLSANARLRQFTGVGGSTLEATRLQTPPDLIVTATEKRFTTTFQMPALSAGTLNADHSIHALIYLPVGVDLRMMLGEVQIEEIGSLGAQVATPFDRRSPAEYLAMCQRYYEKSYDPDVAPGVNTFAGAVYSRAQVTGTLNDFGTMRYSVTKRANPTLTFYNPDNGSTTSPVRNVSAAADGPLTPTNLGQGSFGAYSAVAANAGEHLRFHWTADASLTI